LSSSLSQYYDQNRVLEMFKTSLMKVKLME